MALRVVFIGFMGAGKTYMGKIVADRFKKNLFDTDEQIELTAGMAINEIFLHGGESYFRKMERRIINVIHKEYVVSTGAGIVDSYLNRDWLNNPDNYIVWLNPEWDTLWERISASTRPKVRSLNLNEIIALWQKRCPLYEECADFIYAKDDPQELIEIISEKVDFN